MEQEPNRRYKIGEKYGTNELIVGYWIQDGYHFMLVKFLEKGTFDDYFPYEPSTLKTWDETATEQDNTTYYVDFDLLKEKDQLRWVGVSELCCPPPNDSATLFYLTIAEINQELYDET